MTLIYLILWTIFLVSLAIIFYYDSKYRKLEDVELNSKDNIEVMNKYSKISDIAIGTLIASLAGLLFLGVTRLVVETINWLLF